MSAFLGLILLIIGFIFLGINFGAVPEAIWLVLLKFWPVLLIAVGLSMIIKHRGLALLLLLILVVGVLYASMSPSVLNLIDTSDRPKELRPVSDEDLVEVSLQDSLPVPSSGKVRIDLGGKHDLKVVAEDTNDVRLDLKGPKILIDRLSFEQQGDTIVLNQKNSILFFLNIATEAVTGTVTIPRTAPLELEASGVTKYSVTNHSGLVTAQASGAGAVSFAESASQNPNLRASGTGKISLDTCTGTAVLKASGAASLSATNCTLESVDIDASGAAEVTLNGGSVGNATIDASGAASISLPKPSGEVSEDTSGSASIELR